jgi:hypothetical protein
VIRADRRPARADEVEDDLLVEAERRHLVQRKLVVRKRSEWAVNEVVRAHGVGFT